MLNSRYVDPLDGHLEVKDKMWMVAQGRAQTAAWLDAVHGTPPLPTLITAAKRLSTEEEAFSQAALGKTMGKEAEVEDESTTLRPPRPSTEAEAEDAVMYDAAAPQPPTTASKWRRDLIRYRVEEISFDILSYE